MDIIGIQNIPQLSDKDLRSVAEQVIRLNETGVTLESPLRLMIDNYPGGPVQGVMVVSQAVMLECTKRWCKKK